MALVENLQLKKKNSQHFYFTVPENFSYLKNKISEPSCHELLENELTKFLESEKKVKIEFLYSETNQVCLREEKKTREKEGLLKKAESNSFVNEVKDLFGGKIKTIAKSSE